MTARAALKAFVALLLALLAAGFVALWVSLASGSSPVHAAVESLPVFHEDRGAPGKAEQLRAIGDAVARHSSDRRVQAFVIAWGWHETAFSMRIVAGQCKPFECDGGLARGFVQEHQNGRPQKEWDRLHGLENIDFQAASAVRRARGMLRMCSDVEGAFRAMGGAGCSGKLRLKDAKARVATFERVRARL